MNLNPFKKRIIRVEILDHIIDFCPKCYQRYIKINFIAPYRDDIKIPDRKITPTEVKFLKNAIIEHHMLIKKSKARIENYRNILYGKEAEDDP